MNNLFNHDRLQQSPFPSTGEGRGEGLGGCRASRRRSPAWTTPSPVPRAFTLLEMLVVVAILAVVAGGMIASYDGTVENASAQLVPHELLQIKQAILQFKQDTGYLPGQGPFELAGYTSLGSSTPGYAVLPATLPVTPSDPYAWLHSEANFCQLFENPLAGTGHPLATWDPVTRRGWNGPYLALQGNGLVNVPTNWLSMSGTLIPTVYGVADPYPADDSSGFFTWYLSGQATTGQWGRPYLVAFDYLVPSNSYLVSLGPDHQFNTTDDVVRFIFK